MHLRRCPHSRHVPPSSPDGEKETDRQIEIEGRKRKRERERGGGGWRSKTREHRVARFDYILAGSSLESPRPRIVAATPVMRASLVHPGDGGHGECIGRWHGTLRSSACRTR